MKGERGGGRVSDWCVKRGIPLAEGGMLSQVSAPTEIEMTDFLTSPEFVVPRKSADVRLGKWNH